MQGEPPLLEVLRTVAPERHARILRLMGHAPHPLPAGAIGHGIDLAELRVALEGRAPPGLPERLLNAVHERQLCHAGGRYCAELALLSLTGSHVAVPAGPTGDPLWPSGVSGSITHAGGGAWAAVCPVRRQGMIGLDTAVLVDALGLNDILAVCFTSLERARWFSSPSSEAASLATALFSAKESVFKAIYPFVRRFVDFTEFEMTACCEQRSWLRLRPTLASSLSGDFGDVTVHVRYDGVRVHTAVRLQPELATLTSSLDAAKEDPRQGLSRSA